MIIKSVKFTLVKRVLFFFFIIALIFAVVYFSASRFNILGENSINQIFNSNTSGENFIDEISNISLEEIAEDAESSSKQSYIKWVDFKGTSTVLKKLSDLDIASHNNNEDVKFNWIELMSYLGCKYGGNLALFKQSDLDKLVLELNSGKSISELSSGMKLYNYFYESYDAIFHEYIGEYKIQITDENGNCSYVAKYGLKVFLPIAKNYSFSHYKDFGSSRSYGYRRVHLGNDLLRKYWNSNYRC